MLLFKRAFSSRPYYKFTTQPGMSGYHPFASTSRSDESGTFNAILATRPKVRAREEITRTAKNALARVLDREDLHVKNVMNERFVGNRLGLDFAGLATRLAVMEQEFRQHKDQVTSQQAELGLQKDKVASQQAELGLQKEELGLQKDKIASQQAELGLQKEKVILQEKKLDQLMEDILSLKTSSEGYMRVRNRFISTFSRDVLKKRRNSDKKIIRRGNKAAHRSDVLVDARLYVPPEGEKRKPKRTDARTFKALYGLTPKLALKIKHEQTAKILNVHADAILSNHASVTEKPHVSFKTIIELLEKFGGDNDHSEEFMGAHRLFWDYHRPVVTEGN